MEDAPGVVESVKIPTLKDIRRYYCEYCGICRSKKSLIVSHILFHHQEQMTESGVDDKVDGELLDDAKNSNTCDECGDSFRKPAHLKQHMLIHSTDRSFVCPVDCCHSTFKRKDHLNRHLLQHQGKLFKCPMEACGKEFTTQGNMTRHLKEMHYGKDESTNASQKKYICLEPGCGKAFKYPSKLRKHEESHDKLESSEAICLEPGCLKYFSNEDCLKEHIRICHRHVTCDICGTKQLKKNLKRHLCMHEPERASERITCHFDGCRHTFSTRSNLQQHVKAVHLKLKPYKCRFSGCGRSFTFKHVRNNHEKTARHSYIVGDFAESDEQFTARTRGGRKRIFPSFESLIRKRVSGGDAIQNA